MNLPLASLKGTLLVSPLHPTLGPGLCLKEELVILKEITWSLPYGRDNFAMCD